MSSGGPGGSDAEDEASTPWERPRRWAQDRPESPRVEDLLARLSGLPPVGESRRHRRTADDAADTASVSAGDLIAAFTEAGAAGGADPAAEALAPEAPAPAPAGSASDETVVLPAAGADLPDTAGGASWESVLESLQRDAGAPVDYGPAAPGIPAGPPPAGEGPRGHADHPHRRWLAAGRSVVAVFAVLLLVAAGWDWVSKVRAQNVLSDNNVSAVVTNDTNISTPTARPPSDHAAGVPAPGGAPAKTYRAENILLMGSDSRATAEDAKLGGSGTTTMQSDVLMIAHLSADRSHVTVVSVPRDLYVPAPTCKAWDYQTDSLSDKDYPNHFAQWKITNAYSVGGPQCTVRAVQKLSGLRIDRVIIIDFAGFKAMVDALGGITVNACRPVIDTNPGVGTVLPRAGKQHIDGTQALKLVRARHVIGDTQSDLARIHRQQMVLSIMLRQATSAGVLLNPAKLDSLLQAFVHNVHTDNVTLDDLLNIAQSLGNLNPNRVTFYTLPTVADGDGQAMTPQARRIFNALINDLPLPGESTEKPTPVTPSTAAPRTSASGGAGASSSSTAGTQAPVISTLTRLVTSTPSAPQLVSVAPGDVDLRVVNVAGRGGVATVAQNALNPLGFAISDPDLLLIPGDVRSGITVEYSEPNRAAAVTVAAAVPGATLVPTSGLGSTVRLMLGSSFDGTVRAVAVGAPVPESLSTAASPVVSTVVTTTTMTPPAAGAGATGEPASTGSEAGSDAGPVAGPTAGSGGSSGPVTGATSGPSTASASLSGVSSVNAAQADCF